MKRVPISWNQFLDRIRDCGIRETESALIERIRSDRALPNERVAAARALIESLLSRGAVTLLARHQESGMETLILLDPTRRARIRLRLPTPPSQAARIPLPLDESTSGELGRQEISQLLDTQSNLIAYDRVLSPRELMGRVEQLLHRSLPGVEARFHAVEMPARAAWPTVEWAELPAPRAELEGLAQQRDHLLRGDLPGGGAFLIHPMGDAQVGWNGFLALGAEESERLDDRALVFTSLIADHFTGLLSTLMRLEGLIFYDFLTGIYNRSYYEEQIERELRLALRRDQSMALLIVDIDDFKAFNTRFGYDGGDRVLATVACVLKSALRGTDTLARYGGEEFAIILAPPVPRDEAIAIAERLRAAIAEEPFEIADLEGARQRRGITVSIGGVLFPDHGTTARELWGRANRLVLEAKEAGKNAVRFAPPPPHRTD